MSETNDLVKALGGEIDYSKLEDIFDDYPKLKKYFNENKMDIKFFSFNDSEIVGLDDITVNNKYLFDCICTSLNKTELYELKYSILTDYIKLEKIINENHENYINLKRNIIVRRILEKRNGLCLNEVNRINIALGKNNKIKKGDDILKDGYLPMTFPESIIKKSPLLKTKIKKVFPKKKLNNKKDNNIKSKNNYLNIINSKPSFLNPTLFNYYYHNNKKDNKSTKEKSKNKSFLQNLIDINMNTAQEEERIRTIKKFHFFDKIILSHKYNLRIDSNLLNKRKQLNNNIFSDELNSKTEDNLNNTFSNFRLKQYSARIFNNSFIPDIINSRTRKNIIPFINKISLKKNRNQIQPIIYKQTSKKFIDKRSLVTESNFYKNNQHIFNSLLNDSNNQKDKNSSNSKSLTINKKVSNIKNIKYSQKNISLNYTPDNKIKNEHIIKNLKTFSNNKIQRIFNKNKNYGIIDCLFLDNWEERTQFERKFFFKNGAK